MNEEPERDDILALIVQFTLLRIFIISNLIASISLIVISEGIKRYYFIAALILSLFLGFYYLKNKDKIKQTLIYSIILSIIIFAAKVLL